MIFGVAPNVQEHLLRGGNVNSTISGLVHLDAALASAVFEAGVGVSGLNIKAVISRLGTGNAIFRAV